MGRFDPVSAGVGSSVIWFVGEVECHLSVVVGEAGGFTLLRVGLRLAPILPALKWQCFGVGVDWDFVVVGRCGVGLEDVCVQCCVGAVDAENGPACVAVDLCS